jgi:hypothetical protein
MTKRPLPHMTGVLVLAAAVSLAQAGPVRRRAGRPQKVPPDEAMPGMPGCPMMNR